MRLCRERDELAVSLPVEIALVTEQVFVYIHTYVHTYMINEILQQSVRQTGMEKK